MTNISYNRNMTDITNNTSIINTANIALEDWMTRNIMRTMRRNHRGQYD